MLVTNWITTYGEVIVRVPTRAFGWRSQEAVGGNISYVVSLTRRHTHTASIMQGASACSHAYISEAMPSRSIFTHLFPSSQTDSQCAMMQIATPGGMGLPAFYAPMLAPATSLAVTSLASFSARQPAGTPSGATNEGLSQQCFDRVCPCCHSLGGHAVTEEPVNIPRNAEPGLA